MANLTQSWGPLLISLLPLKTMLHRENNSTAIIKAIVYIPPLRLVLPRTLAFIDTPGQTADSALVKTKKLRKIGLILFKHEFMASIDIQRSHSKPLKDAKKSVERVAKHIADKFDVEYQWDGNTLNFSRTGVHGSIAVTAKDIHVSVNLSFMLMMIKSSVEKEIHRYIEDEFK